MAIELDGRADDSPVAPIALLPQPVAEHNHTAAVRAILGGSEGAAGDDRRAKQSEVIPCDMDGLHLLRMIASGQVDAGGAKVIRGDLLKEAGLLAPQRELGNARPRERSSVRIQDQLHQRPRIGPGERLEQNRIDHREHRRVHSDSDCNHQQSDNREGGRSRQRAQGEPQIACPIVEPWER